MNPVQILVFIVMLLIFGGTLAYLWKVLGERNRLIERFKKVVDVDEERDNVIAAIELIKKTGEKEIAVMKQRQQAAIAEAAGLDARIMDLRAEFQALDEEANLQSFGFYKPHYNFADSIQYQTQLDRIRQAQKEMLKSKSAAICEVEWIIAGSKADGKKQTNHTLKLILRAFNGECDAAIAKVRYNNIVVMETRIRKAWDTINTLVTVQQAYIVPEYLNLKLQELHLAYEYEEKLQAEKEEQRSIREQMREEEIAIRELERAKEEAEREERRYQSLLEKATLEVESAVGAKHDKLVAQIAELQRLLKEAQANKQRAISQAQMTRSGYVYVISNIGSFGENVYKIGMTRRLDPMDRVRELGDASVPFQFDVHAMIYSEDAPTLENELHRAFDRLRLNRVNYRKEFFRVALEEITQIVRHRNETVEFTLMAPAEEFRKTQSMIAQEEKSATREQVPAFV